MAENVEPCLSTNIYRQNIANEDGIIKLTVLMTIKQQLTTQLIEVLNALGAEATPIVDYPADGTHGDYTTNVAFAAAKKAGKNLPAGRQIPMEFAEEIASQLRKEEMFEKVEVAKPGFINFWIKDEALLEEVAENNIPQIAKGKKVIVEYSSPNIAKPFTIGHLRSTIIGDAVANLLQAVGYEVFRDNHVGDWGTQFGKQIYAVKTWGNEEAIETSERPVKELVALYVKFHEEAEKDSSLEDKAREWFKKLEDGDDEARRLWKKCIDWSWKEFDVIYRQLDVSFTENNGRGYGESFFEDRMAPVIEELKEKKLLKEGKEGAQIIEFSEETKLPPLMILKKDGATLYATRDLATDRFRLFEYDEYGKEVLIINEVGAEQALYFQQLYKLEEMLGWVNPGQRVHVKHGLYRFKEGKMSTRKGNVIWLEEVLAEAKHRAWDMQNHSSHLEGEQLVTESLKKSESAKKHNLSLEQRSNVAAQVAIGALKWNDLKRDSKQDIAFDWDEILNMQGNSGPYLQYTFARTQSVLAKATGDRQEVTTIHVQPEERELLRLLARFPDVVTEAAERYAPNVLCNYLFLLAQAFNLFYQKLPILKAEEEVRDFRLQLTERAGNILKEGLNLLGIEAPERM